MKTILDMGKELADGFLGYPEGSMGILVIHEDDHPPWCAHEAAHALDDAFQYLFLIKGVRYPIDEFVPAFKLLSPVARKMKQSFQFLLLDFELILLGLELFILGNEMIFFFLDGEDHLFEGI